MRSGRETLVEIRGETEIAFSVNSQYRFVDAACGQRLLERCLRREAIPDLGEQWLDWLRGPQNETLATRWEGATIDPESFCSVAGLSMERDAGPRLSELSVGDAWTMIPPVTGNGMSMSFESADLAVEPIVDYSTGRLSWAEARDETARRCDRAFRTRLRWAGWLQRALFNPAGRRALRFVTAHVPGAWNVWFENTR